MPGPEADQNLVGLAALAFKGRAPVRLKATINVVLTLSKEEYDEACNLKAPAEIPAFAVYPYAGVPELTEEVVGPVQVWAEVEDLAAQLATAAVERKDDTVNVTVQADRLRFVFERFLGDAPATHVR